MEVLETSKIAAITFGNWKSEEFAVITLNVLLTAFSIGLQDAAASQPSSAPSPVIKVKTVADEYAYMDAHPCKCGGTWKLHTQGLGREGDQSIDRMDCICTKCGAKRVFKFNVSEHMAGLKRQLSRSAREAVYAEMDKQYPKITKSLVPDLIKLLESEDPHRRAWAAHALAKAPTTQACDALIMHYATAMDRMDIGFRMAGEKALIRIGNAAVPRIMRSIKEAVPGAKWELILLLGKFKTPRARDALLSELRTARGRLPRACYLALAEQGYKESETTLLKALAHAGDAPDDALVWALGCCGGKSSIPAIRKLVESHDEKIRLSAIAALGVVGDRDSTNKLMELAEKGSPDVRWNAIYALGRLRAASAAPLLLRLIDEPKPPSDSWRMAQGIYDRSIGIHGVSDVRPICIISLGYIGDPKSIPIFKRLLREDENARCTTEIANAAAMANWKELVPDIISGFARYEAYLFKGKTDSERAELVSPALRKLTGQEFGENAREWQNWLEANGKK